MFSFMRFREYKNVHFIFVKRNAKKRRNLGSKLLLCGVKCAHKSNQSVEPCMLYVM
jgi:hypothetical protein